MAEAAVGTVIAKAATVAGNPLIQVGNRVNNLAEYIQWIETQMRTLQSYLKDAESKRATSHEVANLIVNIRDLAHDIEDILDLYSPSVESHNTMGRFGFLKRAACMFCYCITANNFALEIENIKKRAIEIETARQSCGVIAANFGDEGRVASGDADTWELRRSFLRSPESKIFGRAGVMQNLENEMLSTNVKCKIMSVVGQGGVGKTTVVKRIYQRVKNVFQCSAIVYVSQVPNIRELLLDIAKQVGLGENERNENLDVNLRSWLQEKRYVIYLDDIWNTGTWDLLKDVFPTNSEKGSRIIITSRHNEVGRYVGGESSLVELNLLSENEGRELFNDLISFNSEKPLTPGLIDIGEKIVHKCCGLPLSIVVAVGMLKQRERTTHAWNEVLESMRDSAENDCSKILALSYQDLPLDLKPFFLYFGIFPEDREIFVSELIEAWVAEKFIPDNQARNPKDLAEVKINKMVDRNLIQVARIRSDGRIRSCRIHDALHSLCIGIAKENNFFISLNNQGSSSPLTSIERRITICSSSSQNLRTTQKLRALFCFSPDEVLFKFLGGNFSNLRFLRILVVEVDDYVIRLSSQISNLSFLSYLKLKGNVISIPSCISSLNNLLTLEVQCNDQLPASVWNMKNLKHLLLTGVRIQKPSLMSMHASQLPNLVTLDYIEWEDWTGSWFEKLPNLRKLKIKFPITEIEEVLVASKLLCNTLEDLSLKFYMYSDTRKFHLNFTCYQHLVKLKLHFNYQTQTQTPTISVEFPENLIHLSLKHFSITKDLLKSSSNLSRLEILKLKHCSCWSDALDFSGEHSLSQLQVLVILDTMFFEELIIHEQGFPKLDKIIYRPCPDSIVHLNISGRLRGITVMKGY